LPEAYYSHLINSSFEAKERAEAYSLDWFGKFEGCYPGGGDLSKKQ
jgi:hypothetical protein